MCPESESRWKLHLLHDPASDVTQHHFCLLLFIRIESLRVAYIQRGEELESTFDGRRTKELRCILKPPQYSVRSSFAILEMMDYSGCSEKGVSGEALNVPCITSSVERWGYAGVSAEWLQGGSADEARWGIPCGGRAGSGTGKAGQRHQCKGRATVDRTPPDPTGLEAI